MSQKLKKCVSKGVRATGTAVTEAIAGRRADCGAIAGRSVLCFIRSLFYQFTPSVLPASSRHRVCQWEWVNSLLAPAGNQQRQEDFFQLVSEATDFCKPAGCVCERRRWEIGLDDVEQRFLALSERTGLRLSIACSTTGATILTVEFILQRSLSHYLQPKRAAPAADLPTTNLAPTHGRPARLRAPSTPDAEPALLLVRVLQVCSHAGTMSSQTLADCEQPVRPTLHS